MAINNIGTDFSSLFGNMAGSSSAGVSGSGGMLGDYALIKSGSYKKLLNAYYTKTDEKKTDSEATEKQKKTLVSVKGSADTLKEQTDALKNVELTEENREGIKKALDSFVSAYNSMIDSGADTNDNSVLKNTLWMTQITKANAKLLSEAGIKIDKSNKLSVDEELFEKSHLTTLSTLFRGAGSYIDKVFQKASKLSTISGEAAAKGDRASNYTNNGDFKTLSTNALYDKKV